jgi:hypothetical protein
MSKVAQIFGVLESYRGSVSEATPAEPVPYALLPERPGQQNASCYAALVRRMMEARQERVDGSVFTFVAIRSGDGVSHVVKSVAWELAHHTGDEILVTSLQGVNTVQRQDLKDFRRRFRYVLVDSPAMNASTDFLKLSPMSDSFVLVVKAGCTSRHEIEWAQKALAAQSVNLLGLVLNQRQPVLPRFLAAVL